MKQNRRVQYLAAFAVSLAMMANGVAFFWTAPIMPKFYNNEIITNITSKEISWVVISVIPGTVVGSLVASKISDYFGRRTNILTSVFPFIIGTVFVLYATKAWMLYIARILWGIGAGMVTTMIEEKLALMRSDVRKEMAKSGSIKELFTGKQYRRAVIITAGLRATQLMTGMIPIQQYFGRIIQQSNCGMKISTAFVILGAIRFDVSLISPLIVDRVGRRPLLMCTYFAASVILAIVGSYFFIQQVIGIDNESTSPFRYMVFLSIVFASIIANFGFDVLIFIIPSEIFPLNVKSIAMTVLIIYTAFFNFIVMRGYQIMEDFIGLQGVFWGYAMMAFSGAVFTYFIVLETKGKSLREIQIELQGNLYDDVDEKLYKSDTHNADVENNTELKDLSSKISR